MISGVLYALLAGLMWGLIFVGPLIVPEYPAILQSTGRYLALGLIAVPLAWLGRARLRQLGRQDWLTALALTMMGNLSGERHSAHRCAGVDHDYRHATGGHPGFREPALQPA